MVNALLVLAAFVYLGIGVGFAAISKEVRPDLGGSEILMCMAGWPILMIGAIFTAIFMKKN